MEGVSTIENIMRFINPNFTMSMLEAFRSEEEYSQLVEDSDTDSELDDDTFESEDFESYSDLLPALLLLGDYLDKVSLNMLL